MNVYEQLARGQGIRGEYCGSWETAIVAAGARTDDEHFHFRWQPGVAVAANTSSKCLVTYIAMSVIANTTFGAVAVSNQFALFRANAWLTKSGVGTAVAMGATCKKGLRSKTPSSMMSDGDIRINTTLNTGIRDVSDAVLETNALWRASWPAGTQAPTQPVLVPFDVNRSGKPIVLEGPTAATAEGLVITAPDIQAAGTWIMTVWMEWIETEPVK